MTTTFATHKEEADQIYHDMLWIFEQEPIDESTARACSIVAVDKIIEALKLNEWQNKKEIFYYEEVRRQIVFYI
jgi:hypothetical protein